MSDEATGKAGKLGEGLFSMLIDLLPDYFYVIDSDVRMVYVNKTAADYFGLPKDEIVGKEFKDIEPDKEFAQRFVELGRQIMAVGEPRVSDTAPYPEPDGTLSYYRRYDIPFRHPVTGELMLMGLAQGMTDRVERERQARRIAAMHREMQIAQEIQRSLLPKELQTDWVTETRNPEGQIWNTDGLLKGLARHRGICGSDLLRAIDHENLVFADGEPPGDDRTVVVATFRGK